MCDCDGAIFLLHQAVTLCSQVLKLYTLVRKTCVNIRCMQSQEERCWHTMKVSHDCIIYRNLSWTKTRPMIREQCQPFTCTMAHVYTDSSLSSDISVACRLSCCRGTQAQNSQPSAGADAEHRGAKLDHDVRCASHELDECWQEDKVKLGSVALKEDVQQVQGHGCHENEC